MAREAMTGYGMARHEATLDASFANLGNRLWKPFLPHLSTILHEKFNEQQIMVDHQHELATIITNWRRLVRISDDWCELATISAN